MNEFGDRERPNDLIEIDGTTGGGQLLRTALSLSAITGIPFRIRDVRQTRPNPGLKPQHIAGIDLVAELCDAGVDGAYPDSDSVTFRPGPLRSKSTRVDIGTAGSVTLLFDTVMPIAMRFQQPYHLTVTGGTNVKWAPTVEFYRWVKLPFLARYGLDADLELAKTGFYPGGGGEATLLTQLSHLTPITVSKRGGLQQVDIYSKATFQLADRSVADRQAEHARTQLEAEGMPTQIQQVEYVPSFSPGSSLLVRGVYEHSLVGFDALGERGRTSEEVADLAVRQFLAFHKASGAVDGYMADQLMIFLALQSGNVHIPTVTAHVQANLNVISKFGADIHVIRREDGAIHLKSSRGLLMDTIL